MANTLTVTFTSTGSGPYRVKYWPMSNPANITTVIVSTSPFVVNNLTETSYSGSIEASKGNNEYCDPIFFNATADPTPGCPTCQGFISGTNESQGSYSYPENCMFIPANVETINLQYDAQDRPNRFSVYDSNGLLLATSGWVGTATWNGPWTSIVNGNPVQNLGPGFGTLNVPRDIASNGNYKLIVETGPSNPATPSNISDAWEVNISCTLYQYGNL